MGARVRRYRQAHGWSQEELARRMREAGFEVWRQSTVTKAEGAERPLRVNEAAALAQVLRVPLLHLVSPGAVQEKEDNLAALCRLQERVDHARTRCAQIRADLHEADEQLATAVAAHEAAKKNTDEETA